MNDLCDKEIRLVLKRDIAVNPQKGWVRALHYDMTSLESGCVMGRIDLRLGYTAELVKYAGHIGYFVEPEYRGNHYAAKACNLIKNVAVANHMDVIWITCNPDNWASRKTCEYIGASLVEIIDLPPENDQYRAGERQKCRYRWILY